MSVWTAFFTVSSILESIFPLLRSCAAAGNWSMTENVLDVLLYLFDTYVDADEQPEADREELRRELEHAGFRQREIDNALEWLDGLHPESDDSPPAAPTDQALRIFDAQEQSRLDAPCRGYILYLEQIGILSPAQRELLIDRLLALETVDLDVDHIKWVVLMVLFSQPGQEKAFARMEDLVFAEGAGAVH
jgi:Smg protein